MNIAVAVSGGADSVAMLRGLAQLKHEAGGRGELVVVHYNHRTRDTSPDDSGWVNRLALDLGLRCHSGESGHTGQRSEESLRDDRRAFFRGAAKELGARYLATGHTADDQAETVLFRLLRGSGLRGATGIRPVASLTEGCSLVRPLLAVTRDELLAYLDTLNQGFLEDPSNKETEYARNWFRHTVLPTLEQRFPRARAELAAFASRAAQTVDLVESLAEELLERAESIAPGQAGSIHLEVHELRPAALAAEALRLAWRRAGWPEQAMTAAHWERLVAMTPESAAPSAADFPGGVRVERRGGRLVLAPRASDRQGPC